MGKVTKTISSLKELVKDQALKSLDHITSPASLKGHVTQWQTYAKDTILATHRSDIDATMDAIVSHFITLDIPEECYVTFTSEGALRLNIRSHAAEDLIPQCMEQLLCYIVLISGLSDAERQKYLMMFPPPRSIRIQLFIRYDGKARARTA